MLAGWRKRDCRPIAPARKCQRKPDAHKIGFGLCLAVAAIPTATWVRATAYPTRPIKLIVPYPAGGPTDVLGRMFADELARDLKQAVFVENKGGAQGAIGAEAAAHCRARRLYAVVSGGLDPCAQPDAVQEACLRSGSRFPGAGDCH
jgi:hypothetical protein